MFPLEDLLPRIAFLWRRGVLVGMLLFLVSVNVLLVRQLPALEKVRLTGRALVPRMCAVPTLLPFFELVRGKPEMLRHSDGINLAFKIF